MNTSKQTNETPSAAADKPAPSVVITILGDRDRETVSYIATSPAECRDETDRSAYKMAVRLNDVITMGKVIARPAMVKLASLFLAAAALVGCDGGGGYYGGGSYTAPCNYGAAAPARRGFNIYGPDGVTMVMPTVGGGYNAYGPDGVTMIMPTVGGGYNAYGPNGVSMIMPSGF